MVTEVRSQIKSALASLKLIEGTSNEPTPPVGVVPGPKPNILLVLVDELRFPSVFPEGVTDVAGFLQKFMPNVHRLWQRGVKFSRYYTAASACTPARGTLMTGLYSQQTWVCQTLVNGPHATKTPTPQLNTAFPTFGKLLRDAGYRTPYIGKWHLSLLDENKPGFGLDDYGFDGKTYPDPLGANLQGTYGDAEDGYYSDEYISGQAVHWLKTESAGEKAPWCLTVSFVNPHDKEFFWAGTEFKTYEASFLSQKYPAFLAYVSPGNPPYVQWTEDKLKEPPSYGYPAIPPNWESAAQLAARKPSTQIFARNFQDLAFAGGASDEVEATGFNVTAYPGDTGLGISIAPFSYWSRSLDSYTQLMTIVDQRIGEVLDALPKDVAENTIIVFTADHGDYAGAHGMLSGKGGSVYEEVYHVPLIVVDPSGRFTGETDIPRDGLVSSVDMLGTLVSFGHSGSRDWLTGELQTLYGDRHDVLPMLRSAAAAGRESVLLVTDEQIPGFLNYNQAPLHIIGLRTDVMKLGTYADWWPLSDDIDRNSVQTELYLYSTPGGREELENRSDDPVTQPAVDILLDRIVPDELRAPLPDSLKRPAQEAKAAFMKWCLELKDLPNPYQLKQKVQQMAGEGKVANGRPSGESESSM
jgi:arylsulfatase A-like enzyme